MANSTQNISGYTDIFLQRRREFSSVAPRSLQMVPICRLSSCLSVCLSLSLSLSHWNSAATSNILCIKCLFLRQLYVDFLPPNILTRQCGHFNYTSIVPCRGPIFTIFAAYMVDIELQMINPTLFSRYLKRSCHGNQFSGKNGAKLPTPCTYRSVIPIQNGLSLSQCAR